jgi:hypothetical protein
MRLSSRDIYLSLLSGVSAIALLYLALFIAPQIYHPRAPANPLDSPGAEAEMTIHADKFTPE